MHANSSVFLVAQREMDEEEPALRDLYAYGVIAEIKQVLRVSDDLVKVLVEGKTRARLLELDAGEKYLQATVRPVAVRGIPADKRNQVEALVRSLKDCFEEYLSYSPQISKDVVYNIVSSDSPLYLSEYMPANLLFKYEDKQVILNESTAGPPRKAADPAAAGMPDHGHRARPGRQGQRPHGQGPARILPA